MRRSDPTRRRWLLAASTSALAVAAVAGAVVAGPFRGADPTAVHGDLATGEVVRVADIPAGDGHGARGVFVQTTGSGQLCLWDAPSATSLQRQGGCNPVADPLGGSALSASLAYDGGPAVEDVSDARLIGLVSGAVARVDVLMSDGTLRTVRLKKASIGSERFAAFGYRLRGSDLRRGVGPTAVIARDASGAELARQPTGIGD
ncbi:MAG TPA: hypothetical protein VNK94_08595 [Gaiellaceae bacterium]|nr:hypothetical protein [Gaiellaceae bacterium]